MRHRGAKMAPRRAILAIQQEGGVRRTALRRQDALKSAATRAPVGLRIVPAAAGYHGSAGGKNRSFGQTGPGGAGMDTVRVNGP
jgi:hypothetical protein